MHTLVSLHDVMPRTLDAVEEQLRLLAGVGVPRVTLLVVPGRDWGVGELDRLLAWREAGHELAGHGWRHRARHVLGLKHRVYAALVSRSAAEHLALEPSEILALLRRNHTWFVDHGLGAPDLYVPPAWALGRLPVAAYAEAGFSLVEDLRGVHDLRSGRRHVVPAVGFEAINRWRALVLKGSNAGNRLLGRGRGLLRLALHPRDLRLFLHEDVEKALAALGPTATYGEWFLSAPDERAARPRTPGSKTLGSESGDRVRHSVP